MYSVFEHDWSLRFHSVSVGEIIRRSMMIVQPSNLIRYFRRTTITSLELVHCRRKRDQKCVESDALEEEYAELREIQEILLEVSHRLEDLVRVAIAMEGREVRFEYVIQQRVLRKDCTR
jgi:hypothetical protein